MANAAHSPLRRRIAVATIVVGAVLAPAASLNASMGCGEYSFGFEGTRLLNDGISNHAGPFAIDLPAGTYDVIMQSHDAHSEHPGQVDQTAEQWYFELDSGYVSPLSSDIPDELDQVVDVFEGQVVGATGAISVHHRGEGSVNSVDVVCVGFTPVAPVVEEPVVEAPVEEPVVEAPVEEPVVEAPVEEPVVEAPVEAPVEEPVVEEPEIVVAGPTVPEIGEPAKVVNNPVTTTTAAPSTTTTIDVQVAGAQELPEAQLALTGPSTAEALSLVGIAAIVLGAALLEAERRNRPLTD